MNYNEKSNNVSTTYSIEIVKLFNFKESLQIGKRGDRY